MRPPGYPGLVRGLDVQEMFIGGRRGAPSAGARRGSGLVGHDACVPREAFEFRFTFLSIQVRNFLTFVYTPGVFF